jgi:exoribonuclease R
MAMNGILKRAKIRRATHGPIVGIVDFTNKVRFGFSSKGVPQYLFHPADPRFPPMIVGSRAPPTINQWGIISTKSLVWSTTKSRWPTVQLQDLLGAVGVQEVETEVLRLRYLRPVPRIHSKPEFCASQSVCEVAEGWDEVFNIDPAGCRDVDDILAWRKLPTGAYEFGIGIANVAALVPAGSALDDAARLRAQTLYREGVAIEPMLPTSISEGAGSLLSDGKPRGVVMAVWTVAGSCAQGPVWRTCQVVNKRTFTYESVLEDTGISNKLKELLGAVVSTEVSEDPHRWIELAMISYNRAAAEVLSAKGAGILRRHRGILATEYQEIAEKTGCREIAFLGYAAGEYCTAAAAACSGRSEESEGTVHAGLGLARYCHASSPLRRYADLVNQRILVGDLEYPGPGSDLVSWLNERGKEARAYEREAWCLAHLSAKELTRSHGWVIEWSETSNNGNEVRVRIYVPEWRRQIKVIFAKAVVGNDDTAGVCVKARDGSGEAWPLQKGDKMAVTAFWDIRNTPEYRFVFSASQITEQTVI